MKEAICTEHAPDPVGPYSQAIRANGFIFVSGQVPLLPSKQVPPLEGSREVMRVSIEDQTRQVLENVKAILEAGGSSMKKVVKTTILLTDMTHFATVNRIYAAYFDGETPPARATFAVTALPKGADVEIEAVALE